MNNVELEPFLAVCENLVLQRNKITNAIGKAVRYGHRPNTTTKLYTTIVQHNDSLEVAMKQFPDYEFPVTVRVDIDLNDRQRFYHIKLCSQLRRKFQTGCYKKSKYRLAKYTASIKSRIEEEQNHELEKTVQRLVARNRVSD